jgi:hypothetical protein
METLSRSFHFASSLDYSWNEKTAGICALRPTGLKYIGMKKRSIRHPGSSNTDPNIFECGVANAIPDEEHIGCCATETASRTTPAPLVEEIRAKTLKVAADA